MLQDAHSRIIDTITQEVIDLSKRRGSSSDWPSWVQAAMLLELTVIPCDYFIPEELYQTAEEIIKVAKSWDCKVEYYGEINGKKVNVSIKDYNQLINKIKDWLIAHENRRSIGKLVDKHFENMFDID